MMQVFLAWWLRQLAGLLPTSWRKGGRRGPEARDAVVVTLVEVAGAPRGFAAELTVRRNGTDGRLGRFALDESGLQALRAASGPVGRRELRVGVPDRLFLEQAVTMPLAAERELDTVLRFEMDRLTPFAPDAVHWGWTVQQRDRERGWLRVRLRLVPKAAVAGALAALGAAGLNPASLVSSGAPGRAIPLTHPRVSAWATRGPALAGALAAVLALTAVALPFVQQSLEADRIEAEIAALRPDVDAADGLRRRLQEREAGSDVVGAERARVGDALGILADVTDVLPDDTYLYELTLRDRVLTVTGQSASAARLIPALAGDPALRNPAFAAPVTRNEMTGAESFSIRAEAVR